MESKLPPELRGLATIEPLADPEGPGLRCPMIACPMNTGGEKMGICHADNRCRLRSQHADMAATLTAAQEAGTAAVEARRKAEVERDALRAEVKRSIPFDAVEERTRLAWFAGRTVGLARENGVCGDWEGSETYASLERLRAALAESKPSPDVQFLDHIQGTNCAEWRCNKCGEQWACPSKQPCPKCDKPQAGGGEEA